jgi:hypothetical protein
MNELIAKSRSIKKDADKILKDSSLLEMLTNYGQTKMVGSYAYDLMLNGDIDIHLFVRELDRLKAVKLLNELIEQDYFDNYSLIDWVKNDDLRFPKGYYIGLKKIMAGYKKKWKIDIWFLISDTTDSIDYQKLMQNLDEKKRLKILEFKQFRNQNYPELPSIIIYDAVLKNNIINFKDFEKYIQEKL